MMANFLDETDLATHGLNGLVNFQVAYETLERNESTVSEQPDATMLRSEIQRFQLWATNLGLYRQDHTSLDYRLRDNEVVRSFYQGITHTFDRGSCSKYVFALAIWTKY